MNKKEELTGRVFNRLTVLKEVAPVKYLRHWECLCSCGNKKVTSSSNLKSGNTQSCGCLTKSLHGKRNLKHGMSRVGKLSTEYKILYSAKQRARVYNLPFDLILSDIVIPEYCPVLNIKLSINKKTGNRDSSPSLDRVIPEKGYVKENVVIISLRANRIKNNANLEELKQIVNWLEKNGNFTT